VYRSFQTTPEKNIVTTITSEIELEPLFASDSGGEPLLGPAPQFLGSVKVQVSVRVGSTEVSVAQLLKMAQGAVLPLDRLVDQPLDVLVDGHVVARGTLVAVGEHFGVRITEAASATLAAAQT
jgi:flagellar motor switch protein FliN